jgi:hypothetical protein
VALDKTRLTPWVKCAVCGFVLDVITDEPHPDRPVVVVGYRHAAAERSSGGNDHPVVPVPAEEFAGNARCDFCSALLRPATKNPDGTIAPPEGWRLPAAEMSMNLDVSPEELATAGLEPHEGRIRFDEDWCACDVCAGLIAADKWMRLTRRAADASAERMGTTGPTYAEHRAREREALWRVYSRLRQIAGPLMPFYDA